MRGFDYNAFADMARVFNLETEIMRVARPRPAPLPVGVEGSRLLDMAAFRQDMATRAAARDAAQKTASVIAFPLTRFSRPRPPAPEALMREMAIVPRRALRFVLNTLAGSARMSAPRPETPAPGIHIDLAAIFRAEKAPQKPRTTLSLKTPVALPAAAPVAQAEAQPAPAAKRGTLTLGAKETSAAAKAAVAAASGAFISRRSTSDDLAAAFKAELQAVTQKGPAEAFAPQARRHPLSRKSWAELAAEAEKPEQRDEKSFDLANAFKREMRALLAEQQREAPVAPAPSASAGAAFRQNVSHMPHPRPAAKPAMAA